MIVVIQSTRESRNWTQIHCILSSVFNYDTIEMMRHNIPSHRDRATYERCHTSDKLTKLNNDNLSQNNPNIIYMRVLVFWFSDICRLLKIIIHDDGVCNCDKNWCIHYSSTSTSTSEWETRWHQNSDWLMTANKQPYIHTYCFVDPKFCWNASIISVC